MHFHVWIGCMLANVLAELLKKEDLSPAEASKRTGIHASLFSRWLGGDLPMKQTHFNQLCTLIFTEPKDQALLLKARLEGDVMGPGSDLIEIRVKGEPHHRSEKTTDTFSKLDPKTRKAMEAINANLATDKKLREIIHSLARYFN